MYAKWKYVTYWRLGRKIKQWKIEGDNLVLVSQKEKTLGADINVLMNLGDGHIVSGSDDIINIW